MIKLLENLLRTRPECIPLIYTGPWIRMRYSSYISRRTQKSNVHHMEILYPMVVLPLVMMMTGTPRAVLLSWISLLVMRYSSRVAIIIMFGLQDLVDSWSNLMSRLWWWSMTDLCCSMLINDDPFIKVFILWWTKPRSSSVDQHHWSIDPIVLMYQMIKIDIRRYTRYTIYWYTRSIIERLMPLFCNLTHSYYYTFSVMSIQFMQIFNVELFFQSKSSILFSFCYTVPWYGSVVRIKLKIPMIEIWSQ